MNQPGKALDGFLPESTVTFLDTHAVFGHAERVSNDGVFPPGNPNERREFTVSKASLGYIHDFPK